jgi:type II secretory pathway pseudopilin PulG
MRIFDLKSIFLARCPGKRGFSFMEILVATIILLIGIAGIMGMLFWGRSVLKQKENKARAMNLASTIMEEFMAQSYEILGTRGRTGPIAPAFIGIGGEGQLIQETGIEGVFAWTVIVRQEQMDNNEGPPPATTPAAHTWMRVPFKRIEVVVTYSEENPHRRGVIYNQEVRLVNVVPYPFMATVNVDLVADNLHQAPVGIWGPVGDPGLEIPNTTFNFETPRNLQIIYNIAIFITGAVPVNANLETAVFLDNVQIATVTGTNVLTQPLITNYTSFSGVVAPGPHTLDVRWRVDTGGGAIFRRQANLIVIATEPN